MAIGKAHGQDKIRWEWKKTNRHYCMEDSMAVLDTVQIGGGSCLPALVGRAKSICTGCIARSQVQCGNNHRSGNVGSNDASRPRPEQRSGPEGTDVSPCAAHRTRRGGRGGTAVRTVQWRQSCGDSGQPSEPSGGAHRMANSFHRSTG